MLGETSTESDALAISHSEIFQAIEPGHALLIDGGNVRLKLLKNHGDWAEAVVEIGGTVKDRKGVNLPGTLLPFSAMTKKDHADLDAALALGMNWVALSFV